MNGLRKCTWQRDLTDTHPRLSNYQLPVDLNVSLTRTSCTIVYSRGGDYRGVGGDASPAKILVGGTQMQASPQQLPLLAMSSPHCLEEIAATVQSHRLWYWAPIKKVVYDFILTINTNCDPILLRFKNTSTSMRKSPLCPTALLFLTPNIKMFPWH